MNELMVSQEQFKTALNLFIDKTYTPKVPASEYLMYFGKLAIMGGLIGKNWNKLANDEGMIEVSTFHEHYLKMFEHVNQVEFQGFTIDKNDLNELFGYIKAQAPQAV